MKRAKRALALILALAMVFCLTACDKKGGSTSGNNGGNAGNNGGSATTDLTFDIVVWCPEKAVELTKKQIEDFNKTNTDGITMNATIQAVGEGEAATSMVTDVESGADIYFFAQDQTARLITAGALSKLGVQAAQSVSDANSAGVVAACKAGDDMYAYPLTADNGYFLYYDKSLLNEDQVKNLEDILKVCEDAGRNFCMWVEGSGWYSAGFFFGTGCHSEWTTDNDGKFISIDDDFNSENGLIAAKAIYNLVTSKAYNNAQEAAEFEAAIPAGAVVSGTWDATTAQDILGDNLGVAELPSFTVDGKTYHMGSYSGSKLLGVKPQVDAAKSASIHKLAQYLVSENAQLERFQNLGWGPANLAAQANEAVQASPVLAALIAQDPYAKPQGQISGAWWDISKAIASNIKDSDGSEEGLKKALNIYDEAVAATLNMSADTASAFTVIGAICDTNWDNDFEMTRSAEVGGEHWYSTEALALKAGDQFQVRQGLSWDVQFGAVGDDGLSTKDNFVVEEDGLYYVTLVYDKDAGTGVVSLSKNSHATGWTVIGTVDGTSWDKDFDMEIQADGTTYRSAEAYAMTAGTEFKVRQGLSWDVSFGDGANNYVVAADGTYTVVFDSVSGLITLE